jgi:hypothetical protein
VKVLVVDGDSVEIKLADTADLVGPPGPIGLTGDPGPKGEDGPVGMAGPQGEQGPIGLTGDPGRDGADGMTGPQGPIGLTGDTGPQGEQGHMGPTGPMGPIGLQGPIGLTGPQGEVGPTGLTGPQGDTGPQGENFIFPAGANEEVWTQTENGPAWKALPQLGGPGRRMRFNEIETRLNSLEAGGGGTTEIRSMTDFDGSGLGDGLVIAWSDTTSKFSMVVGGGGSGASSMWVGSNYLLKSEAASTYQPKGSYANSSDVSSFYALKTALPVWYANSGVPSDSLGNNGDFYLNTFNGNVYEKESSTWL